MNLFATSSQKAGRAGKRAFAAAALWALTCAWIAGAGSMPLLPFALPALAQEANYESSAGLCTCSQDVTQCLCTQEECDNFCSASASSFTPFATQCSGTPCQSTQTMGSQSPTKAVTTPFKEYSLQNPLESKSIPDLIGRSITIFIGVSGSFALLMFVYGGFLWLTSQGNTEKVQKGKQVFTWAVIGLVVIFTAYIVLRQVLITIGATS